MSKRQRVRNVLMGVLMILCAVILALYPTEGYQLVTFILSIGLFLFALKKLIYYFTMARCMIGGSMVLIKGIIAMDFSFFVLSLSTVPGVYVMLYLIAGLMLSGAVDLLRAFESKKMNSSSWKVKFAEGAVTLVLSILCLFYLQSVRLAVYVFCIGLVHSALIRLTEAFKKTAIIYIP